jgi:hypothetical protein
VAEIDTDLNRKKNAFKNFQTYDNLKKTYMRWEYISAMGMFSAQEEE